MSRYWPLPGVCTCTLRVRPFREEQKSREKEAGKRKRDYREEQEVIKGYKSKECKHGVTRGARARLVASWIKTVPQQTSPPTGLARCYRPFSHYRWCAWGRVVITPLSCERLWWQRGRGFVAFSPFVYRGTPPGAPESADLRPALGVKRCDNTSAFPVKTVTCAAPSVRLRDAPSAGVAGGPLWCLKAFCIKNSHEILFIADRAEPCRPLVCCYVGKQPKKAASTRLMLPGKSLSSGNPGLIFFENQDLWF